MQWIANTPPHGAGMALARLSREHRYLALGPPLQYNGDPWPYWATGGQLLGIYVPDKPATGVASFQKVNSL